MRTKLLSTLAGLTILATAANAANPNYGTFNSDGYIFGLSNMNTQGYITCDWIGYASPFTPGVPGFRLVIWSAANGYFMPYRTETFAAYATATSYSRQISVPPGYSTTVEVYAVGNQYNNSPNLNWCYVNSWWVYNQ